MISQQGLGRRGGGGNPGSSTCGSWGQPCPRVWHGVTPLQGLNPPRAPHLRGVTPSPPPPSLCGFAGTNRTGEPPPPPQGHGASAFWGLHEGCSRCRGGQGTRVPVSQLRPNHQLPQSSCRFVWICPPPKKKKTTLGATSGLCSPCGPPLSPAPGCPQLSWGKMFSPPTQVGPHGAGFCCRSRQRGAGRDWDTTGKGPGYSQDRHWAMLGTGAKTRWLGTRALGHGQAWGHRP